ncbi:hypothetical protein [Calidifontibacillus oryziterrae]|uniref:hypothetical protein n=1 Tax=Calidifontibacillus oryziterrae TaxID=1191699 RepID=UPI0002D4DF58|nr:hypothetical protein [Calidifontibacillus oryziterrae]
MGSIILLFYISLIGLGIYAIYTFLQRTKERNEYLKDIRDELRELNKKTVDKD